MPMARNVTSSSSVCRRGRVPMGQCGRNNLLAFTFAFARSTCTPHSGRLCPKRDGVLTGCMTCHSTCRSLHGARWVTVTNFKRVSTIYSRRSPPKLHWAVKAGSVLQRLLPCHAQSQQLFRS